MKKGYIAVVASLSVFAGQAGELVPPAELQGYFADGRHSAEFADLTLHHLNELSGRRRLTMVFPNEQTPFFGAQVNYVNVRTGNLTFLMRDLVRAAPIPIVFGRIYDSRKTEESDFGKGWKLSVAETLQATEDGVLYTDASNSTYALRRVGSRILPERPHMTGIQGGSFGPGRAVLKVGALTKIFDGDGSALRLVQVSDGFNNWIRLEYADTGVSRIVSSAGRYVSVTRDGSGRVIGAEDDSGRATHYGYDSDGALAESVDVGGGESRYRYSEGRFLAEVIDPRGVESLSARFDAEGKAVTVHSQHDTAAYEYESNSTTIRNALQQAAVFTFHPSGLPISAVGRAVGSCLPRWVSSSTNDR